MNRGRDVTRSLVRVGMLLVAGALLSEVAACSRAAPKKEQSTPPRADAAAAVPLDASPAMAPRTAPPPSPADFVDVEPWLSARGVTIGAALQTQLMDCAAFRVASPARDGLLCTGGPLMKGSLAGGESLFPLTVWLVDGHDLRRALEVPLAAGPLDREVPPAPGDVNEGMYIHLDAALEPSGSVLEIRERPGAGCARIMASLANDGLATHRKVVAITCRARGRYVLRNGTFVRAAARASGDAP